ncbi:hypothetical protein D3C85_1776600 [compost metagenome]
MKTHCLTIAFGVGTPLAVGEHFALVELLNQHITIRAGALVVHDAEILRVMQALPFQGLHVAAARTRHVVVTLITAVEQVGNPRGALDRR